MFVRPGLIVKVPVGACGVPPHVHVVAACAAPTVIRYAAVAAAAPANPRVLMCPDPFQPAEEERG
jgi:hypothetical protein